MVNVKVYVLNKHGKPLMPCSPRKARLLLKDKKARVIKREPFTIQLVYGSSGYKQKINLGVDSGYRNIGISATTEKEELYASEVEIRTDIPENLSSRRELRRTRRNRKTRYRKPRFKNRNKSKQKGWLAPSIKAKIESHIHVIKDIHKVLPIYKIIVETASFDLQKMNNPEITEKEYQEGVQLGFFNTREYVLFRDEHKCQCCKGKSKDKVLEVHHIESRKTGGNAPNNLITLCKTCHEGYHKGTVELPKKIRRGMKHNAPAFMGIMRKSLLRELRNIFPNVEETFGYITKDTRIRNNLPKAHYIDARCISGYANTLPLGYYFVKKKVRCHNRQLHKLTFLKGGKRKANQLSYLVYGFRLYDKVLYNGEEWFIWSRRSSGCFVLKNLKTKDTIHRSYKKLKLLTHSNFYITKKVFSEE